MILNPSSFAAVLFVEPLLDQISAGINEGNSQRRITILAYKIRSLPNDDWLLRKLEWERSGSIADTPRVFARGSDPAVVVVFAPPAGECLGVDARH